MSVKQLRIQSFRQFSVVIEVDWCADITVHSVKMCDIMYDFKQPFMTLNGILNI